MGRVSRFLLSILTLAVLLQVSGHAWAQTRSVTPVLPQAGDVIRQITVEGAQRIEPGTVKSYLLIREGDAFDAQRLDRSLKSLFATGLFADVSARRQGYTLVISVVENPVINRIAFEGNDKVESEQLQAETTLRPRVIYTRTKVQNDVKHILTLYRRNGRFAVTVEPKIIQLPQNRIDLVFEINEGDLSEVESIRFVGNKEFSDRRLREVVRTKETAWWRFLSNDDNYDPDRLTLDRELLRRFYLSDGYADFRVLSAVAELTPDRRDFFLTFTVEEGARYEFGDIEVKANLRDLKAEQIEEVIEIETGDWYDISAVDDAIQTITNRVGELGFAFVDVRPRVNRDRDTQKIDITFEVNEGPRVFVERIDISGNVRTLDKVIRREFQIVEGDAFNSAKLRRSRQRLQRLNFFEKLNIEHVPGSAPDKAVINVAVEEKSTGSISLGAGYSSAVGAIGEIEITEANFLGRGQNVGLKFQLAAERSTIDLSFTEPYFLDREIAAGFDIFHVSQNLQDTSSYDTQRTGFGLRAGYPITEDLTQSWNYTFRRAKITDVDTNASTLVQAQEGTEYLSQVSHNISYDKRDSPLKPTEGYQVALRTDAAGLGGTLKHLRNTVRGATYYEVVDEWVITVGGKAGYIIGLGEDVDILERYYIGGDDLRGFATRGVGPRDTLTDDALGGEWMYTGTLQLGFPLGLPAELGVSGRVFTDMGSSGQLEPTNATVEDTGSLRVSSGVGITWVSPFGPLGFDVGFPLVKEDFDEEELFRVNFGTRF